MNRVVIARSTGVTVLNPLLYSDLATGEVVNRMFDHLVLTDRTQQYVPGRLVRHWTRSPDGLVWTFHLREAARWHDGRPVTADDAVFTVGAIQDPATGSARRAEFFVGDRPIRFSAPTPSVVRAEMPEPYAPFLAALAWRPMIARHVYEGRPLADHPADAHPVGSGAFRFAGRTDDCIVLRADPKYHLGRAPLDEVVWRHASSVEDAATELCAGRADYVPGVPPAVAAAVGDHPDVRLLRSADTGYTYLGFRVDAPPFDDPRVRRAVACAVDRDALVREVLAGAGAVADGPFRPGSPWHRPAAGGRPPYDPRRAAKLLAEAGRPVAFSIRTVAGDRVKERAATLIAAALNDVGFRVTVVRQPLDHLLREHVRTRRFEAVLLTLVPGADPAFLRFLYHSSMLPPAGWNRFGYRRPNVDRLLDLSEREMDGTRRADIVARVVDHLRADLPQLFLFHSDVIDAVRRNLIVPDLPKSVSNRFMYLHEWAWRR